jgi:hypothetical protein
MMLSAEEHMQLALAYLKDAEAPGLTLAEKRELLGCASRFEALARRVAIDLYERAVASGIGVHLITPRSKGAKGARAPSLPTGPA